MGEHTSKQAGAGDKGRSTLGELIHGALAPLLHGAPLSRSAVSRVVATLLFGLVATGQITLRKLDGYTQLGAVIRQRMRAA